MTTPEAEIADVKMVTTRLVEEVFNALGSVEDRICLPQFWMDCSDRLPGGWPIMFVPFDQDLGKYGSQVAAGEFHPLLCQGSQSHAEWRRFRLQVRWSWRPITPALTTSSPSFRKSPVRMLKSLSVISRFSSTCPMQEACPLCDQRTIQSDERGSREHPPPGGGRLPGHLCDRSDRPRPGSVGRSRSQPASRTLVAQP